MLNFVALVLLSGSFVLVICTNAEKLKKKQLLPPLLTDSKTWREMIDSFNCCKVVEPIQLASMQNSPLWRVPSALLSVLFISSNRMEIFKFHFRIFGKPINGRHMRNELLWCIDLFGHFCDDTVRHFCVIFVSFLCLSHCGKWWRTLFFWLVQHRVDSTM